MRIALLLSLIVPLTLAPALASANPDSDARKSFEAGSQAYREARYKDAIDLFLKANEIEPHPELIYNVGQAYEKLGDVPNALRSYRDYLRRAPSASDRATVETSIRNLEDRLRQKGVQQVTIFSTPAGAEVALDTKIVGRTPWTGEIAPGRHVVVLKASGFPDTAKEFALAGDRSMDLDISLTSIGNGAAALPPEAAPAKAPTPPPPATPAPVKDVDEAPSGGVKPLTIAVLGLGVAGLGAALGLEFARQGQESAARADLTQIGYAQKYGAMTDLQTAARVLVGVGAAATVAGGALLVLNLRAPSQAPARAAFGCLGTTCGVFAGGSFQ